jgi:hypothetical protein
VQGMTDDNKPVIGHHKNEIVQHYK